MRLVVVGKTGQLAQALREESNGRALELISLGRPDIDLSDPNGLFEKIAALQPNIVINAAAYTAVDQAETDIETAFAVNAAAPGLLAEASAKIGIPIVHVSTDYVFDGSKPIPYREDDPTGPLGVYGKSKLEGETRLRAANSRHVILRTSWVFAHHGKNFVRTMRRLGADRPVLRVVSDQFGCPTYATDLARVILDLAPKLVLQPETASTFGTFHASGSGDTSWAGFASAIFALSARNGSPRVEPIETASYPTPAARPKNSRLDCAKLEQTFGLRLPHWHDGLERCLSHTAWTTHQE